MFIDEIVFEFTHFLLKTLGFVLTPFFTLVSFMGGKGYILLLAFACILCLMKKTRWIGMTILLSVFISEILNCYVLKGIIMRPRPFNSDNNKYYMYWEDAGKTLPKGFSMPSGHTSRITAFFVSFCISVKKEIRSKVNIVAIVVIILMILSRCYFMHHYFTDCLVGFVLAYIYSFISKYILKSLYVWCKKNEHNRIANLLLNYDIISNKS